MQVPYWFQIFTLSLYNVNIPALFACLNFCVHIRRSVVVVTRTASHPHTNKSQLSQVINPYKREAPHCHPISRTIYSFHIHLQRTNDALWLLCFCCYPVPHGNNNIFTYIWSRQKRNSHNHPRNTYPVKPFYPNGCDIYILGNHVFVLSTGSVYHHFELRS